MLTLGTVPVLVLTMAYLMKMIITVQARMNKIQANAASLMQEATSAIRTVCSLTSQENLVELFHCEAAQIYKVLKFAYVPPFFVFSFSFCSLSFNIFFLFK